MLGDSPLPSRTGGDMRVAAKMVEEGSKPIWAVRPVPLLYIGFPYNIHSEATWL